MRAKPIILQLTLFAIITFLTAACAASTPSAAPPTQTSSSPMEVSPTPETEHTAPEGIQREPDQSLSNEGPWWVFSTMDGLFAINSDGSGLTQFYQGPINMPYNRRILPAPNSGQIAFITSNDVYNTTLRITSFPMTDLITEIPLTSIESEPGVGAMPGDPEVEAVRAMTEVQNLAFSPDGRSLAFMGAIDGPTSDLYLFSLDNHLITRLTSGPSQGYQPVWSPDGKYIVHTGVSVFGSGAGYTMEGIWAARADDSGVVTLYDPTEDSGEDIIGWVDNQTFLVYSWNMSSGLNNLRTYNIETGEINVVWPGSFQSIAFNPSNATALLSSWKEGGNPDIEPGLYLVPSDGKPPTYIVEDTAVRIIWLQEANLFLAQSKYGVLAIDSNGQYIDLDMPSGAKPFPAVEPDSKNLAWIGESLWIGPLLGSIDNPPREIFNEAVYTVTWDPSGRNVFFFSDSGLYTAQSPDYEPILIAEGLDNQLGYSGWVMP